ncbi:MAG: hypothetical protein MJE68_17040 [Proteobacteria bacterium]|nr:hypothetical protein [Pseudomonadota bacterium]
MEEVTTKTNTLVVPQVQELNSTMQRVIEAKRKQKSEVKELLNINYTLTKLIHDNFSSMQDQVEDIKQHIGVLKSNQSALESKYEALAREMAEAMTETAKELERKDDFLMSQVVSLESHVSDLNSSIENDEWIVDEIMELNQQVNSLVLPMYRMPLLLRKRDNCMVSVPFYTKDKEYRMRALAHPKNNSDSLIMVVCLCVLLGKYDQTLQWPPDVRFTLTLYVNETNWNTKEVTFPSDKNNNIIDCFTDSTRNFIMSKDGSCVEYEIKRGHNISATVFDLDIIRKLSWWEFAVHVTNFMIQCSVYLWYVLVTLSPLLILYCFVIIIIELLKIAIKAMFNLFR